MTVEETTGEKSAARVARRGSGREVASATKGRKRGGKGGTNNVPNMAGGEQTLYADYMLTKDAALPMHGLPSMLEALALPERH
jgi:hypothetical protein